MKAQDRNSYTNVALRRLMSCRRQMEMTTGSPYVNHLARRMAESSYQALRFRYGMTSTWDILESKENA